MDDKLDLDDVCAGHETAQRELSALRAALKENYNAWAALNQFGITDNGQISLADEIRKLFAHSEPSEINALLAETIAKEERKDDALVRTVAPVQTSKDYALAGEPPERNTKPKWSETPTETGAYWENASDADTPAIVWIYEGEVFSVYPPNQNNKLTDVSYWVERGMKYYGPLPLPPPMK